VVGLNLSQDIIDTGQGFVLSSTVPLNECWGSNSTSLATQYSLIILAFDAAYSELLQTSLKSQNNRLNTHLLKVFLLIVHA
jgi:hypothetical protein